MPDVKGQIVRVFGRTASEYESIGPRFFSHFGAGLAGAAAIAPGTRVLDVACGRGAALFPSRRRVGAAGRVVGIDLSAPMLRSLRRDVVARGWTNVELRRMDAERLDLPNSVFDRVLCSFALWFFPLPERALAEFRRVLRPGGKVAIATWASACPFLSWARKTLLPFVPSGADHGLKASRFDRPLRLRRILRAAGFQQIRVLRQTAVFEYADADEWWGSLWSHGMRRFLEQVPAAAREQARAAMDRRLHLLHPRGLRVRFTALYSVGEKPRSGNSRP